MRERSIVSTETLTEVKSIRRPVYSIIKESARLTDRQHGTSGVHQALNSTYMNHVRSNASMMFHWKDTLRTIITVQATIAMETATVGNRTSAWEKPSSTGCSIRNTTAITAIHESSLEALTAMDIPVRPVRIPVI